VILRDDLMAALWPGVTVGEDTLARCVFKLRKALEDDPRHPDFVETIAKRGYRLIAPVSRQPPRSSVARIAALAAGALLALVPVAWLNLSPSEASSSEFVIARAKDHYFQYTREDNEAALALYQRVLAADPDDAQALAGAATALTQRAIRWPNRPGGREYPAATLAVALQDGRTRTAQARRGLDQARTYADRAVLLAPKSPWPHQARGLVLAAQGDLARAARAYQTTLALDPNAWGALINLGDVRDIQGRPDLALPLYARAYAAMDAAYPTEAQRVRTWQPQLGVLIARRHQEAGQTQEAEGWYRRVLDLAPYEPEAVDGLATLYAASDRAPEARALCQALARHVTVTARCAGVLG